jgi:Holliday junction resolvase RusA-like endonuclease
MPAPYKTAQEALRRQLRVQWDREPLSGPVYLHLCVYGEGRGDTDNIAGALMDSAHGILWEDDRVTVIPTLSIEWQKTTKADSHWIIQIWEITDSL